MPNWPALLVAPSLALSNLSLTYALVTPSCARQNMVWPHAVCVLMLLACALLTVPAWRNLVREGGAARLAGDARAGRPYFVALLAVLAGLLSCLVIIAQWLPQWVLSPCQA